MSFKVGLALGGGGVRGFAHVGVLRVLKEEGIPIDVISGTSFGSIVGATYCSNPDIDNCEKRLLEASRGKKVRELEALIGLTTMEDKRIMVERLANFVKDLCLWNLKVLRRWLVDVRPFREIIYKLVGEYQFSDLKIPFTTVAADLYTGEEVVFKEGKVLSAVIASISMAGVFPPCKIDNRTLIDGGALCIVPVDAARLLGSDFVVGVNVEGNLLFKDIRNGLDAIFQAYEISSYELNRMKLKNCDFIVETKLQDVKWTQFSKAQDCIKAGEEAAAGCVDELKKQIARAKRKKSIFSVLGIKKSAKPV